METLTLRADFVRGIATGPVVTVTTGTATAGSAIPIASTAVANVGSRWTSKGEGSGATVGFGRAGEGVGSTVVLGRAGMGLVSWIRERSIDKVRNFS